MRAVILAFLLLGLASSASAHGVAGGAAPGWSWDPAVTIPLAAGLAAFAAGWMRLARRSALGAPGLRRRLFLFLAGWLALAGAVVSPLHQAGETSFTAHMLEHELLMLAAAPLLVLSRPLAVMIWAFPSRGRRGLGALSRGVAAPWGFFTDPVVATVVQAAALWLWHAPGLFDLALAYAPWHVVQHLCFLGSALLFWSAMLHPRRQAHGTAALCLFATSVVAGALGALMAFSQSPWYGAYAALGLAPFGLTPVEDQQLAGVLMWVPGGVVHAGAALAMIRAAIGKTRGGPVHAVQP